MCMSTPDNGSSTRRVGSPAEVPSQVDDMVAANLLIEKGNITCLGINKIAVWSDMKHHYIINIQHTYILARLLIPGYNSDNIFLLPE